MFHIGLIPDRWYNEKFPDFQEEPAIAIYSEKNTVNPTLLHEIHHTQAFSETAKQNLSHKAKYNQGFGYVKKAIRLALEIGCTDELNGMLQRWIREKENETRSRQLEIDKENLPNISNPYQTRIKGAPRKHIKNALEDNQKQKLSGSASTQRSQYLQKSMDRARTCPGQPKKAADIKNVQHCCKGIGHNARRCKLKKNLKKPKSKRLTK
ncbi:hypothetical protein RirG_125430 [Rhizophagus irregularis DAOM 197198w]|uniref:Uncharacterized protein n=1 Tax=Rhizophagus irregularis (strain DAOM 197198w) TaxID=1432141 RepID=A0A015L1M0_RHIIW|nr:hypothetical protein RirG_125430 [Rhizophagus irregularis DAOM 197198w]